jgi:hypothetical protein
LTGFTSTKVQILTPEELQALRRGWEGGGGERLQASPALSRLLYCFTGMEEEEDACKLHLLY